MPRTAISHVDRLMADLGSRLEASRVTPQTLLDNDVDLSKHGRGTHPESSHGNRGGKTPLVIVPGAAISKDHVALGVAAHRGVGKIILTRNSASESDTERADHILGQIDNALDALPSNDYAGLKAIAVQESLGFFGSGGYVHSKEKGYVSDEIWLEDGLFSREGRRNGTWVVAHEMGHRVQLEVEPSLFNTFKKQKLGERDVIDDYDVRDYGEGYKDKTRRSAEMFAESYAHFALNKTWLKQNEPDLYSFWNEARGGQ